MPPIVTSQQFKAPSILSSIQQGLQSRQLTQAEANKERLRALEEGQLATRQRALGVSPEAPLDETPEQALNRAFAADPEIGNAIFNKIGADTQAKREEWAAFATGVLEADGEEAVTFLIDERARKLESAGRDATETRKLKEINPAQRTAAMQGMKAAALTEKQRQTFARSGAGAGEKAFAPVTLVNPETGEKILVNPVFDERTGKSRLEKAAIPAGFEISRETKEEERAADLAVTEEKEVAKLRGKKITAREQKSIDEGLVAADGFANLKRAKQLLDGIETGGFSNASLSAKRLFGVESANEAELSNRMGKAVLSQLRTTFGAAFTATEGESLKQIEANFGKSTAGNKRLIAQTMKLVERAANRGIRAAKKSGDLETVKEIEDAMAFTLATEAPLPQGVSEDDITETMRIHGMTRQQVIDRLGGQ